MFSGLEMAYWPNINHLVIAMLYNNFEFKMGTFHKEKFKNRCEILSANGKQVLTIPIHAQTGISDNAIRICNHTRWRHTHLRALDSAYNKSPFYWYYKPEIYTLYDTSFEFLISFNTSLYSWLISTLQSQGPFIISEMHNGLYHIPANSNHDVGDIYQVPYIQVFANKFEFIPNLSVLDLLFNLGPESLRHLRTITIKCLS